MLCDGPGCERCSTKERTPFAELSSSGWTFFLQSRRLQTVPARSILFQEGAPAATAHVLCQGLAKLSVRIHDGTSRIVRLLSAEQAPCALLDIGSFGAHALHSMTCETLTPCQIAHLDRQTLAWFQEREPKFAAALLNSMSHEARLLVQHVHETSTEPIDRRLARSLVRLARHHGAPSAQGISLDLPLHRREWAELVGTTRETISRLLSDLSKRRVIECRGQHIMIVAYDRLEKLAGDRGRRAGARSRRGHHHNTAPGCDGGHTVPAAFFR